MKSIGRAFLVWLTLVSVVGCTSMQAIPDIRPSALQAQLKEGDEISVVMTTGETREMTVTKIDDHALYGVAKLLAVEIPLNEISSLQVRTFSAGKTAGLSVGVLVAIYIAALAIIAVGTSELNSASNY